MVSLFRYSEQVMSTAVLVIRKISKLILLNDVPGASYLMWLEPVSTVGRIEL
jgi:hypothetical protein